MTSFYKFYEQIRRSKLNESVKVLLEMPMRPEGDPTQYANKHVSPHAATTAKDGYVGRTSKRLVDTGADLERELTNQNWQQAKADRPELGVYDKANDMARAEKKAASAETGRLGLDTSREGERTRSGRMVQTNKTDGPEDVEALSATNRGLPNLLAKIEDIKGRMRELEPQVQDYSDPEMMKLVRELYAATTIFNKDGRLAGPEADHIQALHQKMAELINQDDEQRNGSWEDL
jgi:hypothetical protein